MKDHEKLTIIVPGSTANLGPGFDSVGLAVNRKLILNIEKNETWEFVPICSEVSSIPSGSDNLMYKVAHRLAAKYDAILPPCRVEVWSDIPLARGLGSSAAAIVAGIELANQLADLQLTNNEKLRFASLYEGHPDNVGASLYGGLVIGSHHKDETYMLRVNQLNVEIIAVIPHFEVPTKVARSVLPTQFSFEKAVEASAIGNVLVGALLIEDWQLAGKMMDKDLFHQPYRTTLIPQMTQIFSVAKQAGAFGVALSGAGPTVLCLAEKGKGMSIAKELRSCLDSFDVHELEVDLEGCVVKKTAELLHGRAEK
ncbi:homoserine kinase [Bacillus sp. HMF5848]|uniref:homoserine kinase n=1 Tax=Bacillus sp. HMF5848 TaxID=2495421 RepID=UPI000F7AB331|nr:homoserine kinase [Bacillus sp. HMF5848]RSK28433.1 homoserine kinase [Bacillus sp. HMF5848]